MPIPAPWKVNQNPKGACVSEHIMNQSKVIDNKRALAMSSLRLKDWQSRADVRPGEGGISDPVSS